MRLRIIISFIIGFASGEGLADELVNLSRNIYESRHVTGLFERVGLPGCVGSIDCVYLVWNKCPAGFLSACKGKEKLPTLALQVVASHTKKISSVSSFFAGATHDKKIARFDPAILKIRGGDKLFTDLEWTTVDLDGTTHNHKGAYYVCDGGYHAWQELVAPYKNQLEGSQLSK